MERYIDYRFNPTTEVIRERNRLSNRTVITTARAWAESADGSREARNVSLSGIFDAYADYVASRQWN